MTWLTSRRIQAGKSEWARRNRKFSAQILTEALPRNNARRRQVIGPLPLRVAATGQRVWLHPTHARASSAKGRQLNRWLSLAREGAGTSLQSAPLVEKDTWDVLKERRYGS